MKNKTQRQRTREKQNLQRGQGNIISCRQWQGFRQSQDIFSTFLYRDHVTRYRYQLSKLKNMAKAKTLGDQNRKNENRQLKFYSEQLKLLKTIKQNRNLQLCHGSKIYKSCDKQSAKGSHSEQFKYQQIKKIKTKIRRQVHSLNHEFLRQYLYHNQPFNKMLVQINEYSNAGLINQTRINELKQKIIECIKERKKQRRSVRKNTIQSKKIYERKILKEQFQKKIDKKFQKIWDKIGKQIRAKVKMQGQYNIYKIKNEKNRIPR